jgi:RHS repeat-associated protein
LTRTGRQPNETGVLTWNPNHTLQQLAITDGFNSGGTQTCGSSYDDLARLTVFDCGSGKWGQDFGYDQYDNLTQTVIPPDRTGSTWNPGYSVSPSNNHVIGATYDGSGNMTNDGGMNVYGYDRYDKLAWTAGSGTPICGTSGKCITYDAFGRMVEKSNNGAWTEIWYTQVPSGQITMSGTTAIYGYWPSPGRGTFVAGGTNMFLHQDWLSNDRIVSAVSGHTVSADRAYAPYGEQYNTFGSTNPIYGMFGGITGDFDPGVLFDTPNRELAQYQGRWISPDPAGTGWNQYAYVNSNPLSYIDPSELACYPIERLLTGGCGAFMNNGVNFGGSWDEFYIISAASSGSYETVDPSKPWIPIGIQNGQIAIGGCNGAPDCESSEIPQMMTVYPNIDLLGLLLQTGTDAPPNTNIRNGGCATCHVPNYVRPKSCDVDACTPAEKAKWCANGKAATAGISKATGGQVGVWLTFVGLSPLGAPLRPVLAPVAIVKGMNGYTSAYFDSFCSQ